MPFISFDYKFLFRTFVLLLIFSAAAVAQPSNNYQFYPHDYARSPLDGSADVPNEDQGPLVDGETKTPSAKNKSQKNESIFEAQGKRIESFGLIISGIDYVAMQASLTTMLEVYNKTSIKPSMIMMLGENADPNPKEIKSLYQRLAVLGVKFATGPQPPDNFKISRVPAWILSLKEGDIVLEGLDSPQRFINSKGEFMDPKEVGGPEIEGN